MLAGREPVSGVWCVLANFEYILEMLDALQVAAVVPSKVLVAGDERSHGRDPLPMAQGSQPPGHCALGSFKSIAPLQGVASMACGP